jgi:hypothetical protein
MPPHDGVRLYEYQCRAPVPPHSGHGDPKVHCSINVTRLTFGSSASLARIVVTGVDAQNSMSTPDEDSTRTVVPSVRASCSPSRPISAAMIDAAPVIRAAETRTRIC